MDKLPVSHSWANQTASFYHRYFTIKNAALGGQVKFIELGCTASTHLHAFLTWDPYPNVCDLYHANVIGTITFMGQKARNIWGVKKGCKLCKSILTTHADKTHPSKFTPFLQDTWTLVKQKLKTAPNYHQDEFQIQFCLKILHAMALFWTDLSFLSVTHSTFNFPDI